MTESMIAKIGEAANKVFFPFLGSDNIFTRGISVKRVLFRIPGTDFDIYKYGFLIAVGLLLALLYADKQYKKFGINPDKAFWIVFGGAIAGVVGARAYYVIFSLDNYRTDGKLNWLDIISTRDGGLAIYGGVIGGFVVAAIICAFMKVRLSAMFDIAAMGFFIGQCLGRWGNFFNQEAYGSLTKLPWGMTSAKIMNEMAVMYPNADPSELVVHPCFLYESILCLVGFLILFFYKKHRKFDGELFLIYIGWYGLGRGLIEGLRTDSLYIGSTDLRVSQLVGFICAVVSVVSIILIRIIIKKKGNYKFFYETENSIASIADYEENIKKSKEKNKAPKDLSKAIDNAFDDDNSDTESEEISEKADVSEDENIASEAIVKSEETASDNIQVISDEEEVQKLEETETEDKKENDGGDKTDE